MKHKVIDSGKKDKNDKTQILIELDNNETPDRFLYSSIIAFLTAMEISIKRTKKDDDKIKDFYG